MRLGPDRIAVGVSEHSSERPTVTVVQKTLAHYRVPFFIGLKDALHEHGVALRVLVGQPDAAASSRNDLGTLPWSESYTNRYLRLRERHLIWQPVLGGLGGSDLVVVEQASKLLLNYLLIGRRRLGRGPRLGFWGHGRNFDEPNASALGEIGKRALINQADWWFSYTRGTAELVESFGVDQRKVTVVQNATDTRTLRGAREAITAAEINAVCAELGIGKGPVAIAVGSVYPAKRPGFLIDAADHLRRIITDFELIVIGDGPARPHFDHASRTRPWLHVLGAIHGVEIARWASPASVVLNPGLVGLAVVDAFGLGLPTVTCDLPFHSPEIEYVVDGVNGIVLPRGTTPEEYASVVANLFKTPSRLAGLSEAAKAAGDIYTIEEMVRRFADGVLSALALPRQGSRSTDG